MRIKAVFGSMVAAVVLAAGFTIVAPSRALAHCDTTAGPVIPEAKAALEKGDVTPTLKWVRKEDEGAIREAFGKAILVRAGGPEAKELADRFFLETLVRLHRAGEGAPYTGIEDGPPEPIAAMADSALAEGSADAMIQRIGAHMSAAIAQKFKRVSETKKNKDASVEAGREFVAAYVTYVHFVEGVHDAIVAQGTHHEAAAAGAPAHDH
jgi:hypothetical protein